MSKTVSARVVFTRGFFKENPVFALLLGMCPTLGVTTSALNGLGMGLATTAVLLASNVVISLVKNIIPDSVRIPSYIVIIASFVTMIDLAMEAFLPDLHLALGIFIPLIVVNCIILGRAESFASKHRVGLSLLDGLGMGLGFSMALTMLGGIREVLGSGSLFEITLPVISEAPMLLFLMPPGAFLALGLLIAGVNALYERAAQTEPQPFTVPVLHTAKTGGEA
ncbi:electron transport complex subunit RsxE [Spirochaeta africana]|uniref:Ion-translocating oxidoreductase complex subunit E n=1 Tax=Spirochaeta africana (strain ATCC 700263 / DSM 8902 / Z-7692) TaxID=889378 RepID=H9UGJ3_SPIAZ|nr:electron transport complex subunit E [Spirochaeta africana]AFG36636.1 electron transport complex, RnfABCDGE type, E subunit [Spirochaeta africana DSM 8902]